jgi:hypothetical protein
MFVGASLLLSSCASNSMREQEKAARMDSVAYEGADKKDMEANFSTDTLNEAQKELFSKRAVQKLEDFYGYAAIASNNKYDTALRIQAMTLAEDLFSDTANIRKILVMSANMVIEDSTVRNMRITQPATAINDSVYRGEISFDLHKSEIKDQHIGFIIKKINKDFGTEKRSVWEAYLEAGKVD